MILLKTTKERIALRQKPKKHKRTVERNGVAFEIVILLMLMRVASKDGGCMIGGFDFNTSCFLGEEIGAFCVWADAEMIQNQHLWHTSGLQLSFPLKRLKQNNFIRKIMAEPYS
jgi:hypothetical protein